MRAGKIKKNVEASWGSLSLYPSQELLILVIVSQLKIIASPNMCYTQVGIVTGQPLTWETRGFWLAHSHVTGPAVILAQVPLALCYLSSLKQRATADSNVTLSKAFAKSILKGYL